MFDEINPSSILRLKAVRALTGLSRSTVWRLCRRSEFPQPLKLTKRLIGWRAGEVLNWLDSREHKAPSFAEEKPILPRLAMTDASALHMSAGTSAQESAEARRLEISLQTECRKHGTAHNTNGTLHKVSSAGDSARIGTQGSLKKKGVPL